MIVSFLRISSTELNFLVLTYLYIHIYNKPVYALES